MNFLSTRRSTDGSTSSEPMGLCITSIVKTQTDNHTLDDRNHQGYHTTLLRSETLHHCTILVRGRQRAVCDNQHRATCPGVWQVLDSTCSMERGRQGPPVVPARWCHPHSLNESLAWLQQRFAYYLSAAGETRSGHRIHRTWTSQIFVCGDTLRTVCMATTPRLSLTWTCSNHSSNKSDPKKGMRESHRELCPPDPNVPAAPGSSSGAHFLSASETKSFCRTDLKLNFVTPNFVVSRKICFKHTIKTKILLQ